MPCDCCQYPPYSAPFIECQSLNASGTKKGPPGCAWPEFTGPFEPNVPIKYFLKYGIVATRRNDCNGSTSSTEGEFTYEYSMSGYEDDRREIEWSCIETADEETGEVTESKEVADVGSAYEWHQNRSGTDDPDPASCTTTGVRLLFLDPNNTEYLGEWEITNLDCGDWAIVACTMANPGGGSGVPPVDITEQSPTEITGEYEREPIDFEDDGSDPGPPPTSFHIDYHATQKYTVKRTLSEEWTPETTEDFVARIMEELGEFSDEVSGGCGAARFLSPDESSLDVQKMRYRIVHSPTGTCYLKVWYKETFLPSPTEDDPEPTPIVSRKDYTWTGSGFPCGFNNSSLPPTHTENRIKDGWVYVDVPESNGTVTVEIEKYSCLPWYEPGEGDPDGYPANE